MRPKEMLKTLQRDGWNIVRVSGSHHILQHPTKSGNISLPMHNKEMTIGLQNTILKAAGLK